MNTKLFAILCISVIAPFMLYAQSIVSPSIQEVCQGENTSFSITSTVPPPATFQWQVDDGSGFINISNSGVYIGVDQITLVINNVNLSFDGYLYRCIVNGTASTNGKLNVDPKPAITEGGNPNDITVCKNTVATFEINSIGGNAYQWQEYDFAFGWSNLTNSGLYNGTDTKKLTIDGVQKNMNGYRYRCRVSNTNCSTYSLSAALYVNDTPKNFITFGGGSYCEGGMGYEVKLSGSETGVNYSLLRNSINTGIIRAGTGGQINFGFQTNSGTYTVNAFNPSSTCEKLMEGQAYISIIPAPQPFLIEGGGQFCEGSTGPEITLSGSEINVRYLLYRDGIETGQLIVGTNAPISFGTQNNEGIYTIRAENMSTSCSAEMNGSAIITKVALPQIFNLYSDDATFCEGGTGAEIMMDNSEAGFLYELYLEGNPTGITQIGTGNTINFGFLTTPGNYTATASKSINPDVTCTRQMNGSVTIIIDPLPIQFNVEGGGSFCEGGTGVPVTLSGSQLNHIYQLYFNGTPLGSPLTGTGFSLSFGLFSQVGSYTVLAKENNSTLCETFMTGEAIITINPLPSLYTLTGGGDICEGEEGLMLNLTGSDIDITYSLMLNGSEYSTLQGTGNALTFGPVNTAGTYTVSAQNNTTSCISSMNGNVIITVNAAPQLFTVTGGGRFCTGSTGVAIGLSGSNIGITYQLINATGIIISQKEGTSAAFSFGLFSQPGIYSVKALNTGTSCERMMTPTVEIIEVALPIAFDVTGGGNMCEGGSGLPIGLSNSQSGFIYTLWKGSTNMASQTGTGGPLSFGTVFTEPGIYHVTATGAAPTACINNMNNTISIIIDPKPEIHSFFGNDHVCQYNDSVQFFLDDSQLDIIYQIKRNDIIIGEVTGTGNPLSLGYYKLEGLYSLTGHAQASSCEETMDGTILLQYYPLMQDYNLTGENLFCEGSEGSTLGLSGSEAGIAYKLFREGSELPLRTLNGNGNALVFGKFNIAGTYYIIGTSSTCDQPIGIPLDLSSQPAPSQHTVSGGGGYCPGGDGTEIILNSSDAGISYHLVLNNAIIATQTGPGTLTFSNISTPGTYTILAEDNITLCSSEMTPTIEVFIYDLPTAYQLLTEADGSYCQGENGVEVWLSSSETDVNYTLYHMDENTPPIITAVATLPGTGNLLSFGKQQTIGQYYAEGEISTVLCSGPMADTITVSVKASPNVYSITPEEAHYCENHQGAEILLNGSQIGVAYHLKNITSGTDETMIYGTSFPISFGYFTGGTYIIEAEDTLTKCIREMNNSSHIIMNPAPAVIPFIADHDTICNQQQGVTFSIPNSEAGVNYILVLNGIQVPGTLTLGGGDVSFPIQYQGGEYQVFAQNSCDTLMPQKIKIVTVPEPMLYNTGGGGDICNGDETIVTLSSSELNTTYVLYHENEIFSERKGTGTLLNFSGVNKEGTYTIKAKRYGCIVDMNGFAEVNFLPGPNISQLSGGGQFCEDGGTINVLVLNSKTDVLYKLYRDNIYVTEAYGNNNTLYFNNLTEAGIYNVLGIATNGCSSLMDGDILAEISTVPDLFGVVGGGSTCSNGTGIPIGLNNSQEGVTYRLLNPDDIKVDEIERESSGAFNFAPQTQPGLYTIEAVNGACNLIMSGNAQIDLLPSPQKFQIVGGGSFCFGSSGVAIQLNNYEPNTTYHLYRSGTYANKTITGNQPVTFEDISLEGYYRIKAENNSSLCWSFMRDSVLVEQFPSPSVTLTDNVNESRITAYPGGYINYSFELNNETIQNGDVAELFYGDKVFARRDTLFVTVTNEYKCKGSDFIIVEGTPKANAFTPNDDNINDVFMKGYEISIFNRWGQELFHGTDGWDGRYNGARVAPGTYFYIYQKRGIDGEIQREIKGSVTVILK